MLLFVPSRVPSALRSPGALSVYIVVAAAGAAFAAYSLRRPKPTAEELERERREYLASVGRLVDGSITETRWNEDAPTPIPETLTYRYRIAGVTYECAQDVTPLAEQVRDVRIDLPVQVRFDPRNPGDSIVVAEGWNGLRHTPHGEDSIPLAALE